MTAPGRSPTLAEIGAAPSGAASEDGTMTDVVDEAREAFAAYHGLGKDIIERLIAEIIDLRAATLSSNEEYQVKVLSGGKRVLAREVNGELEAYKFANITQAKKKAALYPGSWVAAIGRPFYVRVP